MAPYVLAGALNLMAIGMALIVALRIAYGGRVPLADPIYALVRSIGIVLVLFGWLAILISIGWVFGPILFVATIVIVGMIWRQVKVARQRAHMELLALAVEKQIPLPACVDAFATEQSGGFAQRAGMFSADLRSGVPLPDAIADSRGVLPRLAELSARIGRASGRLAPALRDEMMRYSELEPIRREVASRTLYFVMAFAFAPMVLTFMCIKIVPAFVRIFNDFEVELPAMTIRVIQLMGSPITQSLAILAIGAGCIVGLWAAAWYVGLPMVEPPGLRWFILRFDRATIQRALAFPAEQGQPLGRMIELLGEHYPSWSVRSRLYRAADGIENGQNWIDSLRSQSLLGKADAAVLSAAQRVGNLPWALREMAESNERRLIFRLQALVQFSSFAVVFFLGSLVGMFVIAFFLPLVKLIQTLT